MESLALNDEEWEKELALLQMPETFTLAKQQSMMREKEVFDTVSESQVQSILIRQASRIQEGAVAGM